MQIKRVKEESYESIELYLNEMMSLVSRYSDLCFVDHEGKRYMIGIGDEKFAIVENDNGELNPCCLSYPNPMIEKYDTEGYKYNIITYPDLKEVTKESKISDDRERLTYMLRTDDFPRDTLEYIQFIDELTASVLKKYDVTQRNGVNSALAFCNFHEADIIRVETLKKFMLGYRKATYDYCLGLNEDFYYQPLIRLGDLLIGTKRVKYPSKEFVDELSEKGFNRNIPSDLSSMLTGSNEHYKTLKLITDNYQKYIKEQ